MIVNFLTHVQDKDKPLKRQISIEKGLATTQSHRRSSSNCSASNYVMYRNPSSVCSTPTPRRQSISPCNIHRSQRHDTDFKQKTSTGIREKIVDFDFTRHKSTENLSVSQSHEGSSSSKTFGHTHMHPSKSCFKHQNISSKVNLHHTASKYELNATAGCRQCGHSKCHRAQSLEKDERFNSNTASTSRLNSSTQYDCHRNSCSNLFQRQNSSESQPERSSLMGSMQRISLYDAHRVSQILPIDYTPTSPALSSCSSTTRARQKSPYQRLRECVTCADVFLEAMGNALTIKNNNSSRYVSN